jgi:hypothetical protein
MIELAATAAALVALLAGWRRWPRRIPAPAVSVAAYGNGGRRMRGDLLYPGARNLEFRIEGRTPRRQSFPLRVTLCLSGPDGREHDFSQELPDPAAWPCAFTLSRAGGVLDAPGAWAGRVTVSGLRPFRSGKSSFGIRVLGQSELWDDLRLESAALLAWRDGRFHATHGSVPADTEALLVVARLRPASLDPAEYGGMGAAVELGRQQAGKVQALASVTVQLEPHAGAFDLAAALGKPRAAARAGAYELRWLGGGRVLGVQTFELAPLRRFWEAVTVESFGLEGIDSAGRRVPVGETVVSGTCRAVAPHLTLRTARPGPVGLPFSVALLHQGAVKSEYKGVWDLAQPVGRWQGPPLELPVLGKDSAPVHFELAVFLPDTPRRSGRRNAPVLVERCSLTVLPLPRCLSDLEGTAVGIELPQDYVDAQFELLTRSSQR